MKFDVQYTDGFGRYVMVTEDGRAAMVDTQVGHVAWSTTVECFLRLGPFYEATEPPEEAVLELLDDRLEGRVEYVEVDPQETLEWLQAEYGHLFGGGKHHEG